MGEEREGKKKKEEREIIHLVLYLLHGHFTFIFLPISFLFFFLLLWVDTGKEEEMEESSSYPLSSDYLNLIPPSPSSLWTQLIDQQRVEEEKT